MTSEAGATLILVVIGKGGWLIRQLICPEGTTGPYGTNEHDVKRLSENTLEEE
jgi:hypothetical protein